MPAMSLTKLAAATRTPRAVMLKILIESEALGTVERRGDLWALSPEGEEYGAAAWAGIAKLGDVSTGYRAIKKSREPVKPSLVVVPGVRAEAEARGEG